MGYFIRVLGTKDPDINAAELQEVLQKAGFKAELSLDPDETDNQWTMLDLQTEDGLPLARIERIPMVAEEHGMDELVWLRESIQDKQPQSAVRWLNDYFDNVKVIYVFQLLHAAFEDSNYEIVSALRVAIWEKTGGILHAEGEGFSNEEGFHILWEFADTANGDKYCAVRNENGEWEKFRMDLGDAYQRMAFQEGNVPPAAVRL